MTSLKQAIQRIDAYKDWHDYLSLANLGLSSEDLEQLIPRLLKLKKLNKLDLSNNKLTSLPYSIGGFSELIFLNLSNNKIEKIPISIRELTASDGPRNLRRLNLANNNLKRLPWGLRRDMLFKELILDNNSEIFSLSRAKEWLFNFGTHMILTLNRAITNTNTIAPSASSIVKRDMIWPFDFETEMKFILSHIADRLKTHLNGGPYAIEIEKRISSSRKTEFGYLDLSDKCLSDDKLAQLVPDLAKIPNLMGLKLSSNNLIKFHWRVESFKNLRILDLDNNDFIRLPVAIKEFKSLMQLNLCNNNRIILPKDIEKSLPNLKTLFLDSSLTLRNLVILINSTKYNPIPSKIEFPKGEIAVHGLSNKLTDKYGKFHENLRGNFMKIATIVSDEYPNINAEEFLTLFEGLTNNEKQSILNKSISLPELGIGIEENNTEKEIVERDTLSNLKSLTNPSIPIIYYTRQSYKKPTVILYSNSNSTQTPKDLTDEANLSRKGPSATF